MSTSLHPDRERLAAWRRFALEPGEEADLERHLEECDECAAIVAELPTECALVERLRAAPVDPAPIQSATKAVESPTATPSRWRLNSVRARGGVGEVWSATDTLFDREVVVKRLRPEVRDRPSVQRRFVREARITARLDHPGIVEVHDLVEDGPNSYYVMALVEGPTLRDRVREYHTTSWDEPTFGSLLPLLQCLVSVASTIEYAHGRGVLHRDLKTENVVVGEHGQVTVVDWGIARVIGETTPEEPGMIRRDESADASTRETVAGDQLGTPSFMSPEQVRGELDTIDQRTDVYALSAMLYEILTGRQPFHGATVEAILDAVLETPPRRPSLIASAVPPALEELCLRGLAKSPDDRPDSAREFRIGIEDWMQERVERRRRDEERERFFRLSRDLLAIVGAHDGVVRRVNPASENLTGWTVEEMVGMTDAQLIHPDDMDDVRRLRQHLLETGTPVDGLERRIVCKDGSVRWLQWNVTPIVAESAVYIVGRDVTAWKRLVARTSGLLESMPDAVVVADAEGRIELVNDETERLFGYPRGVLIGGSIFQLVADRSREEHARTVRALAANPAAWRSLGYERFYGRRADGSEFPAEVRHSALETEEGLLFTGSIRHVLPSPSEEPAP